MIQNKHNNHNNATFQPFLHIFPIAHFQMLNVSLTVAYRTHLTPNKGNSRLHSI